jgi:hypothetical protein
MHISTALRIAAQLSIEVRDAADDAPRTIGRLEVLAAR